MGFAEITLILLRLQRPRGDLEITLLCRITYLLLSVFKQQLSWKLFAAFCLLGMSLADAPQGFLEPAMLH